MQFLYVSKLELQRRSWDDIVTSQLSIEPFARKHPGSHSHQGGVTPPLGGSDRGVTPTGESRTPLTPVLLYVHRYKNMWLTIITANSLSLATSFNEAMVFETHRFHSLSSCALLLPVQWL